jgi:predicted ATP-grasp superfamily ATP-dependent carboligase
MHEIRFSNFVFDRDTYYVLYLSELKGYGIGHFLADAIARVKHLDRSRVKMLFIAPDILDQYNYDNIIIVNPSQKRENLRQSADQFMTKVSNSPYIHNVMDQILSNQEELFLYMFESNPHLTLDQKDGVKLIGPKSDIVSTLSNKISLYDIFSDVVPMAPYHVCQGIDTLKKYAEEMLRDGTETLFVSLEKSAAGANSMIVHHIDEIDARFAEAAAETFLLTAFIPHVSDPTSLGVVINEEEVFVAGIADQKINGTRFEGSIYPSKLSTEIQKELTRLTRIVGKKMAALGYRGIFGCDFIVTDTEAIYFIETNPRKQGTTMEFCCMLEGMLPDSAPNLPELEFHAVMHSRKAPLTEEPSHNSKEIFWETYNYKVHRDVAVHTFLSQYNNEKEMFENIFNHKTKKEYIILEHAGEDFSVRNGSFLGRVVSVGKSYRDTERGIEMGKKILDYTYNIAS